MDLADILKRKDKEKPENFWTLVIGKAWVESCIWKVVGDKTEILAEGMGTSWQEEDEETLVQAVDSTLSAAAGSVEDEKAPEPNKVVFGLPPSWVEDGNIKREKLNLLKKLSQELELTPAGFVVLTEALVHYLKTRDGAPPNAALVGVLEDCLDVTLVQNGKIESTVEVSRSISLGGDVAEGLARFEKGQYPSRIVLYNHRSSDLEEAKQSLLETKWEEANISFLHTPKVEILPEGVAVLAVSLAGGAEVGHAKFVEASSDKQKETSQGSEAEAKAPGAEKEEKEELREANLSELGFLQGEDIAQAKPSEAPLQESQEAPVERGHAQRKLTYLLGGFLRAVRSVKLPKVSIFAALGKGSVVGIVLLVLFGLLISTAVAYWYLPKAEITVYVSPKKLETDTSIKIDPALSVVNLNEGTIPGKVSSGQVSGEKTTSATGTKTVGDRARGEVVVFRVGPPVTLGQGTVLESPNGLRFTLNEDTSLATGSSIRNPSENTTSVTATDIGAQYNLAGGTEFSVGNFSKQDMVAENKEAFSGGTSREISAVSESDRENLEKELTSELKNQGLEKIKTTLQAQEILVNATGEFVAEDRDFSHKVGEEASTLKLSLKGKVRVLAIPKEALNSFLVSRLESNVPDGYLLRQEQIEVEFKQSEEENSFSVHVVANLLPKINPEEIARNVSGKYIDVAKQYLSTIPGYTRSQVSLSISLPGRLKTLPRQAKNIIVEVSAER